MGSLPGAGHFGRPREKRKWVSATLLLGIHTRSWHLLICFRPPSLPPLTEAFHSFCDWCHSGGGSWWTATHLTPLPISLQTETTGEENRQKKKKSVPLLLVKHSTELISSCSSLFWKEKKMKSLACFADWRWDDQWDRNRPLHNLWGVELRAWKGEWEKLWKAEVALPEKEGWMKNDF